MSWKVEYESHVKQEIKKQLAEGILSKDDLHALMKWVDQIESYGLNHVQTN